MGSAPLPARTRQHRSDRLLEPGVGIGDHQLHPGQATGDQLPQEAGPTGTVLAGQHVHPEDLPVAVGAHAGGHHAGHVHDPPGLTALDRQRVHPDIRIGAGVQRAGPERRDLPVEGLGQLRDLRLGQALDVEGRHQAFHPTGGHPTHIALGHHGHQGTLGPSAGLQQPVRVVAALAELGDGQLQGAHPSVQPPRPVAVALVDPLWAPLAQHGAAGRVGLGAHQRLHKPQHHLPQQVGVGCLQVLAQPAQQVHGRCDHRILPLEFLDRTS